MYAAGTCAQSRHTSAHSHALTCPDMRTLQQPLTTSRKLKALRFKDMIRLRYTNDDVELSHAPPKTCLLSIKSSTDHGPCHAVLDAVLRGLL